MKRKLFFAILAAIIFCLAALTVSAKGEKKAPLSPGLLVLAKRADMARSALLGSEISFEKADFARALNLSRVENVTVTKVPDASEGKLMVGNTVLTDGQTVLASNVSLMKFVPAEKSCESASFCFSVGDAPYEIECTMYYLDKMNYSPTLSLASSATMEASTYRGVSYYGSLSAYDPDGDEMVYEIVSYPKKGSVTMINERTGEYRYTPVSSFVGKDSFSYIARDKYGNYSASAEVSLTIKSSALSVGFDDMENSGAHAAAIALTEKGIMSGTKVADGYYFNPEGTVSRAEFVVMAMKAKGISTMSESETTVFADNDDIPAEMRGYISAAYELGYVKGSMRDGELCFLPHDTITRAEAAVIVGRMIDASVPTVLPVLDDSEDIPAWAEASVNSLVHMGMLDTENGEVRAAELVTRADTARMLCSLIK